MREEQEINGREEGGERQPLEIEATLAVVSETPLETTCEIVRMKQIGVYRLIERAPVFIRDIYVDTGDSRLAAGKIGLRLRRKDSDLLYTLKGPSEGDESSGGVKRLEIEEPWSNSSAGRLVRALEAIGIVLEDASGMRGFVTEGFADSGNEHKTPAGEGVRGHVSPGRGGDVTEPCDPLFEKAVAALGVLGLSVIQDRETRRIVRQVTSPEGTVPAELVVDTVTYRLDGGTVIHREVEVEARGKGGVRAVSDVTRALARRFPGSLRPWDFGKLLTGNTLAKLMASGRLGESGTAGGVLGVAAYDLLEKVMESGDNAGVPSRRSPG